MNYYTKSLIKVDYPFKQKSAYVNRCPLSQSLIDRLTELSVSDDWEEAKHEWRVTGRAWYIPLEHASPHSKHHKLPEPHCNNHPNRCLCGHPIVWHFEVENTKNGILEILGSEHINNYMIIRHLREIKGLPEDAITEEKIREWLKETVETMKYNWWWKEYGDDWKKIFDGVKHLDLIINTRVKSEYYDYKYHGNETERCKHYTRVLDKNKSIVWRWNRRDNPKAQKETRGYPTKKLW